MYLGVRERKRLNTTDLETSRMRHLWPVLVCCCTEGDSNDDSALCLILIVTYGYSYSQVHHKTVRVAFKIIWTSMQMTHCSKCCYSKRLKRNSRCAGSIQIYCITIISGHVKSFNFLSWFLFRYISVLLRTILRQHNYVSDSLYVNIVRFLH